jgi:hypothetical protein
MSENPYTPPGARSDLAAHLGPVVLSCQDRSEKERLEALEQSLLFYYLMPLVVSVVLIGFSALALEKINVRPSIQGFRIIAAAIFALVCGGMYWQLLHRPRKPSLVLHEEGFRFKKTTARFDDMASLRFGRDFSAAISAIVSVNRFFGRISRSSASAVALFERSQQGSMTLVFKTGATKSLDGMLIRPQPEDVKRFLERLRAMRPGLVEETPISSPVAPGLDELPSRMRSL